MSPREPFIHLPLHHCNELINDRYTIRVRDLGQVATIVKALKQPLELRHGPRSNAVTQQISRDASPFKRVKKRLAPTAYDLASCGEDITAAQRCLVPEFSQYHNRTGERATALAGTFAVKPRGQFNC